MAPGGGFKPTSASHLPGEKNEREESREAAEQPSLPPLHKTQENGFIFHMKGRGTGHFCRKG